MPKSYYDQELTEASMRPRWCRDTDRGRWWLPWEVHAILDTLAGHEQYQSGGNLSHNTGINIVRMFSIVDDIDGKLDLITGTWEDELFPEAWATKGHTEGCGCDRRRYYTLTARGREWLETIPVRPRRPFWKRPTWWVGVVFWAAAAFTVAQAFFR